MTTRQWNSAWSVTRILAQRWPMPPYIPQSALERGRAVHYWCELWDKGCAPTPPPAIAGYCQGWKRFEYAFSPSWREDGVELPVDSDDYHGVVDRTGWIKGGKAVVLEIKCGTPRPQGVDGIQLAAYARALEPTSYDKLLRVAVYLSNKPEGDFKVQVYADPHDHVVWDQLVKEIVYGNHTPRRDRS